MKDRLLNILLTTFVVLIALNFLLPKPETKTAPVAQGAYIQIATNKGTAPTMPVVTIVNPGNTGSLDTCADIQILKDYKAITLDGSAQTFCQNLILTSGEHKKLDFNALAVLFENPGEYAIKYKNPFGEESIVKYTQEERGMFRNLFSSVFYAPILNLFVLLLTWIPGVNLGYAIIAITIILRLVLLFPQHSMMVSSRKLQAIQPKIKEIQEKHKGNQAEIWMKLMDLYKTEGVNPLGSCLPLLIQLPILIVLYNVINSIGDASNQYYLYSAFASFDPTAIDFHFYGMDLKGVGGITGAVLAILVGGLQWLQMKISFAKLDTKKNAKVVEKKADGSLESANLENPLSPEMMNIMMTYMMPVMIAISTYFFPAGLGLYWFVGAIFMLIQQLVANKVVKSV